MSISLQNLGLIASADHIYVVAMDLKRDISSLANGPRSNMTGQLDPSLECDGLNASNTHSLLLSGDVSYDHAVRFPLIDIIAFWPNRTSRTSYYTGWSEDVHVEVVCLRPDSVSRESRLPPSGENLINAEGAKFPTSEAAKLSYSSLGWLGTAVIGIMLAM